MDVQNLQDNADIRIKFASLNHKGEYIRDAGGEYRSFFEDLERGWTAASVDPVLVDQVGRNTAWAISDGKTEMAAVAHETGMEFLVAFGAGLTLEAIIFFTKWGWKKWNKLRPNKVPSSLQIERVKERLADMARQQRDTAARLAEQQRQLQSRMEMQRQEQQRQEQQRLARYRPPAFGISHPGFSPISAPFGNPSSRQPNFISFPIRSASIQPPLWERSRPPLSRAGSGWDPSRFGFPGATAGGYVQPPGWPRPIAAPPGFRSMGWDHGSRD